MARVSAFLSSLFLIFVSALAAQAMGPAAAATCPFQYNDKNGEIRVSVMINGKGPFSMKLDTGSTMSLVTPEVAKRAGIEALARTYPCGAYGASVALGAGTMDDIEVGGVALYAQPCLIGDLNNAIPCDGILSGDIFDRYAVQINFSKSTMTFYNSDTYTPAAGDTCIPIHLEDNHLPVCSGSIDNMPVRLAIDTGFDGSLTLLPGFVKQNRLADRYLKVSTVTTYSLEGIRDVGLYSMKDLDVGTGSQSRRVGNLFVLFDDFDSAGVQYDYDGLLGTRMLSHWTVTLDYAHSRIVFH